MHDLTLLIKGTSTLVKTTSSLSSQRTEACGRISEVNLALQAPFHWPVSNPCLFVVSKPALLITECSAPLSLTPKKGSLQKSLETQKPTMNRVGSWVSRCFLLCSLPSMSGSAVVFLFVSKEATWACREGKGRTLCWALSLSGLGAQVPSLFG